MNIEFLQTTDITLCGTEAIVNPANEDLWISSNTGQILLLKCGDVIELEAMAQKPVVLGEAIISSPGQWQDIKLIIHAIVYGGDLWFPSIAVIDQGVYNSLLIAHDYQIQSISMPVLGEVCRRASMENIAQAMLKGIGRFLKHYPQNSIETLKIIIPDEATLNTFYKLFSTYA